MFSRQQGDPYAFRSPLVGECLLAGLLACNLAWSTLCLGGYRPETQIWGYALTAALVSLYWILRGLRHPEQTGSPALGDWILGLFLAYAAANVHWVSPVPWIGWIDFLCWAQLLAVYWIVRSELRSVLAQRFVFSVLLILALIGVALGYYQRFVDPEWLMLGRRQASQFLGRASGSFGIPNSLAAFIMLVLPATVAMALRPGAGLLQRILFGYLGLFLISGFFMTLSRGGWLALALALALWPLLRSRSSIGRRLATSAGLLGGAALVLASLYFISPGTRGRLDAIVRDSGESTRPIMWKASWRIFQDAPWLGGGAGSFNTLFEKYRPEDCQREPQWAHNEYLNTLSDYGLIGFVLLFGGGGFLIVRIVGRKHAAASGPVAVGEAFHPWVKEGLGIGMLGFGLQLFVDFHFKLPALAMAFASISGIANQSVSGVQKAATAKGIAYARKVMAFMLATACAGVFLLHFYPLLRAEAIRYVARQRVDKIAQSSYSAEQRRTLFKESERDMEFAVSLYPGHAQAWADLSYIQSLWSRERPSDAVALGRQAELSSRHALALSAEVPEFWVRLGVAQDMQGKWIDAGQQYIEALTRAPASVNMRYYLAFHYSLRPITYENARALIDTCLRLDPSHGPAQALKQHLASTPDVR